ncbi:MAG: GNAT family N-acetyltransferase [Acidobacteriota bacterium]|nr:MAG: GNAT family N-acetyltransferase [Acidobacteriota bacterium]
MQTGPFKIRRLTENDSRQWLDLRRRLWDGLSEAEHIAEMREIFGHRETQLVLVAEYGEGRIAGFLEASIRPFVEDCRTDHVGYIEGWFVLNEHRRKGIGSALVRSAEAWAKENSCEEMASDTEIGNEQGLAAHLGLGFKETSRLIHLRKEIT